LLNSVVLSGFSIVFCFLYISCFGVFLERFFLQLVNRALLTYLRWFKQLYHFRFKQWYHCWFKYWYQWYHCWINLSFLYTELFTTTVIYNVHTLTTSGCSAQWWTMNSIIVWPPSSSRYWWWPIVMMVLARLFLT